MSTYNDRVTEAAEETAGLLDRLVEAAYDAGYGDHDEIDEAIRFAAIQLDPEDDDYETWEATVLARLADVNKTGER